MAGGGKSPCRGGSVNGNLVKDIVLDNGCSRTMVRRELISEDDLTGEAITIRCAHGDTVLYPLALVRISVDGRILNVEAAASTTLPVSVLLGTDVPQLGGLLDNHDTCLAMMTRAQQRQQAEQEARETRIESEQGVEPTSISGKCEGREDGDEKYTIDGPKNGPKEKDECPQQDVSEEFHLTGFDDDLFNVPMRTRQKLTRKQRRQLKQRFRQKGVIATGPEFQMGEIRELQKSDPSLEGTRRLAKVNQYGFFFRDGLLYRRWTPRIKNGKEFGVDQLVLPREFRLVVMKLSHCIPFSGHLGRNKTTSRVLQLFYWPTLFRDIKHICSCCEKCQRCSTKRPPKAPLIPLPVIAEPFRRIAMDIIGPLPRSRSGNRYILVICDYSTRYPEAVPLRNITAETIAEELMKLIA